MCRKRDRHDKSGGEQPHETVTADTGAAMHGGPPDPREPRVHPTPRPDRFALAYQPRRERVDQRGDRGGIGLDVCPQP